MLSLKWGWAAALYFSLPGRIFTSLAVLFAVWACRVFEVGMTLRTLPKGSAMQAFSWAELSIEVNLSYSENLKHLDWLPLHWFYSVALRQEAFLGVFNQEHIWRGGKKMVLRTTFVNADHFSWCSKGPWCLALKQTAGGAATSCNAPEAVLVAWQHPRGSCVPSGTCPRVGMVCSVTGWIFPIVRAPDASTGVHLFALLRGVSTIFFCKH